MKDLFQENNIEARQDIDLFEEYGITTNAKALSSIKPVDDGDEHFSWGEKLRENLFSQSPVVHLGGLQKNSPMSWIEFAYKTSPFYQVRQTMDGGVSSNAKSMYEKKDGIKEKYGIDDTKTLEFTEGMKKQAASEGEIGFVERMKYVGVDNSTPFLSGLAKVKINEEVSSIAKKMENNEKLTPEEISKYNSFMAEQAEMAYRGLSMGGHIADIISNIPAFAGELVATGGIGSLGSRAIAATITKGLQGMTWRSTLKTLASKEAGNLTKAKALGLYAAKGATEAVGDVSLRLPLGMPHFVVQNYQDRRLTDGLCITDKGDWILKESQEKPFTTFLKAYADSFIEIFSEMSGAGIGKGFGLATKFIKNKIPRKILADIYKTANKLTPPNVRSLMEKTQFYGVLEEYGEERLGALLRAPLNLGDSQKETVFERMVEAIFPDKEQALIELGAFSIWGGMSYTSINIADKLLQRGAAKADVETLLHSTSELEKEEMLEEFNRQEPIKGHVEYIEQKTQDVYDATINAGFSEEKAESNATLHRGVMHKAMYKWGEEWATKGQDFRQVLDRLTFEEADNVGADKTSSDTEVQVYNQPIDKSVDINREVNVVDLTEKLDEGKQETPKTLKEYLHLLIGSEGVTTADNKAIVNFIKSSKRKGKSNTYVPSHIVYSSKNADKDTGASRKTAIKNVSDLIRNSVFIEKIENNKKGTKPDVDYYYRFYVPVKFGNKVHTVRIVAENNVANDSFDIASTDLYDVIIENKKIEAPTAHQRNFRASDNIISDNTDDFNPSPISSENKKPTDSKLIPKKGGLANLSTSDTIIADNTGNFNPETITIKDMLSGVLDGEKKPYETYFQSDKNLNLQNVVDLTNEFEKTPTIQEVKDHINELVENGAKFATLSPDWFVNVKKENSNRKQKRINDKIANQGNFLKLDKQAKKRHNKYVLGLEALLNKAEYAGSKENIKQDKKPNIKAYHYFATNVKIGKKNYKIVFDTEEYKNKKSLSSDYAERSLKEPERDTNSIAGKSTDFKPREEYNDKKSLSHNYARTSSIADKSNALYPKTVHLYNITEIKNPQYINYSDKLHQGEADTPRGSYTRTHRESIIEIFETADESTLPHELSHFYVDVISIAAMHSETAKDDLRAIDRMLGHKEGEPYTKEEYEAFAEGFELYLREGKAPNSFLERAFENFKEWLVNIVEKLELSDVQREAFSRLFMSNEEYEEYIYPKYKEYEDLVNAIEKLNKSTIKFRDKVSATAETWDKFYSTIIIPIETRLYKIAPILKRILREHTFTLLNLQKKDSEQIEPFLNAILKLKKDKTKIKIRGKEVTAYYALTLSLNNRDSLITNSIFEQLDMKKEYQKIRSTLDELHASSLKVGMNVGFLANYFPRRVKQDKIDNFIEMFEKMTLEEEINIENQLLDPSNAQYSNVKRGLKDSDPNNLWSKEDKARYINNLIRGFGKNNILLSRIGQLKFERQLSEISAEQQQFYEPIEVALATYVIEARKNIEERKFFGGENKDAGKLRTSLKKKKQTLIEVEARTPVQAKFKEINRLKYELAPITIKLESLERIEAKTIEVQEAIADLDKKRVRLVEQIEWVENANPYQAKNSVIKRLKNDIAGLEDGIKEFSDNSTNIEGSIGKWVREFAQNGIIYAKDETIVRDLLVARFNANKLNGVGAWFRDMSTVVTLNDITNAITQIGDLTFAAQKFGLFDTIVGMSKVEGLTRKSIGLDNIAEEFKSSSRGIISNWLNTQLKLIGLEAIDGFGKNTIVNTSIYQARKKAKKNDKKFNEKLKELFGEKSEQVKKDLVDGKTTDDVLFIAFNDLADIQPITADQMSEGYQKSRLFYILKTYSIKALDIVRNECFMKLSSGVKLYKEDKKTGRELIAEGLINLVKLQVFMWLFGVPQDLLKDFISNRTFKYPEYFIDNLLIFGIFSRYSVEKMIDNPANIYFDTVKLPSAQAICDISSAIGQVSSGGKNISDVYAWSRVPLIGKLYYNWLGGSKDKRVIL